MYEVDLEVWVWSGWDVPIISYSMSLVRTHSEFYNLAHFYSDGMGMVLCCILMATNHVWSMWNTFYMYKADLVWVCRKWEVPIISYSMSPVRTPPESESYWPTPFWSDGIVWCCGNMTASHCWRLLNTFYRYEVDRARVLKGKSVKWRV